MAYIHTYIHTYVHTQQRFFLVDSNYGSNLFNYSLVSLQHLILVVHRAVFLMLYV